MKIYQVRYTRRPDDDTTYSALVAVSEDADAQRACEVVREKEKRRSHDIVVTGVEFINHIPYADPRLPALWPMPSRN